jgi:hypothetical protein
MGMPVEEQKPRHCFFDSNPVTGREQVEHEPGDRSDGQ